MFLSLQKMNPNKPLNIIIKKYNDIKLTSYTKSTQYLLIKLQTKPKNSAKFACN